MTWKTAGKVVSLTCTHERLWEVNVDSFKEFEPEDYVKSPTFSITIDEKETKWNMLFYPKGTSATHEKSGAVFIRIVGNGEALVGVSFSLLNHDYEEISQKVAGKHLFSRPENYHLGFHNFTTESFIFDPKNRLIKNNKITFMCKIYSYLSNVLSTKEMKNSISLNALNDYGKLLEDQECSEYSDFTILVDEKSFHLHKCILATRSPVFQAMFRHDMIEKNSGTVKIQDIRPEVFHELILFIYTGKVNNLEEMAPELLVAADKYSFEDLKMLCEEFMCHHITEDNALEYASVANIHSYEKLKPEVDKFIASNLKKFLNKPEFESYARTRQDWFFQIVKDGQNKKNIEL